MFFLCQNGRMIASLPSRRHLISCLRLFCFLCWTTKGDNSFITNCSLFMLFLFFEEMCYWTVLHAGHARFLSFCFCSVCAWEFFCLLFLSGNSSMASILHLWTAHFFGDGNKKVRSPPLESAPTNPHPPHLPDPSVMYSSVISTGLKLHHRRLSLGCSGAVLHSWWKLIGGDPGAEGGGKRDCTAQENLQSPLWNFCLLFAVI